MSGESTPTMIVEKAKAGYSALYLLSSEDMRVQIDIKKAAGILNWNVFIWTLTKGLKKEGSTEYEADSDSPLGALDAMNKLPTKSIFVLRYFHHFVEDPAVQAILIDLIHKFKLEHKMIIILTPVLKLVPEIEKEMALVETQLPKDEELGTVLDGIIEGAELKKEQIPDPELRRALISSALGLTTPEAENAFSLSIVRPKMRKASVTWDPNIVLEEKCATLKKNGLLQFYPPGTQGLKQVGGMANLKEWIGKRRNAFGEEAREFGLPPPKGILMVGPPGAGKSVGAKAISEELRLPLLRCDMGRIFAGLVGASEDNARKVIQTADAVSPCVLWLDEIEKGFAGSDSGLDSGVGARVLGTFLTWMQEKLTPVFVYATANNVAALPPELLRKGRFDESFSVLLPSPPERKEIFQIHLDKRKRSKVLSEEEVIQLVEETEGFSGAEIEAAIVEGMYTAFSSGRDLKAADIKIALSETVPLSKMMAAQIDAMQKWCEGRTRPANTIVSHKTKTHGRAVEA